MERLRDAYEAWPNTPQIWVLDSAADEITRLRRQRDELLEALEPFATGIATHHATAADWEAARTAFRKAKGEE